MKLDPLGGAEQADHVSLWRRIGWLAAIWGMSVAVLGAVAFIIRSWIS